MKDNILYIVIPCYNEEEVLEETTKRLKVKMNKLVENKIISNKKAINLNELFDERMIRLERIFNDN